MGQFENFLKNFGSGLGSDEVFGHYKNKNPPLTRHALYCSFSRGGLQCNVNESSSAAP